MEQSLELELRNGNKVTIPLILREDMEWVPTFERIGECMRCGGKAKLGGGTSPMAGMLLIYPIDVCGVMRSLIGACDCVFGAWRNRDHGMPGTSDFRPGFSYADAFPSVPPGLSQEEWNIVRIYHRPGMDWKVLAGHIDRVVQRHAIQTPADDLVRAIALKIGEWLRTDPPKYDMHRRPEHA